MDTMKLFMAIPDRINFLQLGRYGCFSEQTYRNLFENDSMGKNLVDWYSSYGSIKNVKERDLSSSVVERVAFSKESLMLLKCD